MDIITVKNMRFKTLLTCAFIALAPSYCSAASDGDDYCFFNNVEQVEIGSHLELRNLGKLEQLVRNPNPKLQGFIEEAKREHDASLKNFLAKYDDLYEASSNQSAENVGVMSSENDNRFSHMECVYADKVSKLNAAQKKMLLLYLQCINNSVISEMDDASQWPAISGEKLWKYLSKSGEVGYYYLLTKRVCSDYINSRLFDGDRFNHEYVADKILGLSSYSEADADKIFSSLVINFSMKFPLLLDAVNECVEDMRAAYSSAITYGWSLHNMSIPKDLFLEKACNIYGKANFMNSGILLEGIDVMAYFARLIICPETCIPDKFAPISAFDLEELRSASRSFKFGLSEGDIVKVVELADELALQLRQINSAGAEMQHAYPNFASDVAEELSDHDAFEHLLIAQDPAYQD